MRPMVHLVQNTAMRLGEDTESFLSGCGQFFFPRCLIWVDSGAAVYHRFTLKNSRLFLVLVSSFLLLMGVERSPINSTVALSVINRRGLIATRSSVSQLSLVSRNAPVSAVGLELRGLVDPRRGKHQQARTQYYRGNADHVISNSSLVSNQAV